VSHADAVTEYPTWPLDAYADTERRYGGHLDSAVPPRPLRGAHPDPDTVTQLLTASPAARTR
jgi:hypothetical protein